MAETVWQELDDFLGIESTDGSAPAHPFSSSPTDTNTTSSQPSQPPSTGHPDADPDAAEQPPESSRTAHAKAVYVKVLVTALDEKPEVRPSELERIVRGHLGAVGFPVHLCSPQFLVRVRDTAVVVFVCCSGAHVRGF